MRPDHTSLWGNMARRNLHHDLETFSLLSLTDVGVDRYSKHISTEILMCAWAYDDGSVKQWLPEEGEVTMPAELEDGLLDERVIKHAWNASFERHLWQNTMGIVIPYNQWRDAMVLAQSLSLPGKLSKAGEALRMDNEHLKATDGKNLINWFSKLRPATKTKPKRRVYWYEQPARWEQYKQYNVRDVIAERQIWWKCLPLDMPWSEWELWFLDQEINERGVPVDIKFARHCARVKDDLIATRIARMKEITGLEKPNAPQQLLPWLQDLGYPFADMKKGHVRRAIEENDDLPPEAREVAGLRLQAAMASVKKYNAVVRHTGDDGLLRNTLQFGGAARTARWAGRVFQVQNLAKPIKALEGLEWRQRADGAWEVCGGDLFAAREAVAALDAESLDLIFDNPMEMLSACVRPTIMAPPGYIFIDADSRAIENVVLGWLSDDQKILGVFRENRDPYIDFATYMFQRPYDELMAEYKAGDSGPRTTSKPGVLGCGYMLSAGKEYEDRKTGEIEATGLLGYAWGMGVKSFTPAQAELSVAVWRRTFHQAVRFWDDIQAAAFRTVNTKRESSARHIGFSMYKNVLRMHLPSGRNIHYIKPFIKDKMMPWGKMKPNLHYEGKDSNGNWAVISTHPGKITENADQAIARDLLAHGITLANREGIDVRMHVHDQIIGLCLEEQAGRELDVLIQCMTDRPWWCPDMPIAAAGHISKWFVKD